MRLLFQAALLATIGTVPAWSQAVPATSAGTNVNIGDPVALTFYLAPAHPAAAEAKARSIQTVGSPDYHQFLTVREFVKNYAVSDAELRAIEGSLTNLGFTVGYVFPNHLAIEVTGTVSTAQTALGMTLKHFNKNGKLITAPDRAITLPTELVGKVRSVGGLNTGHHASPRHVTSAILGQSTVHALADGEALVGGTPGHYLPADFANFYGVNGIYKRGYQGRGSTIGIVTLNNFKPADAFLFWTGIGLQVAPDRITQVDVDGGIEAATNNDDGAGETTLDVEYSGALAPAANVRVYIAPNITTSNFINGFEAAASENLADTISTSWGEAELDYFQDFAPAYPSETYLLDDFHDVFLEMALQGQTVYAAAGDSGAFDTVRECSPFGTASKTNTVCNAPYSIDSPSNDPLITAAGGTTLPFDVVFKNGFELSVKRERAWSWDYIASEAVAQHEAISLANVFSVGTGGGVSSYFPVPWYQKNIPGITRTVPGQFFTTNTGTGPLIDVVLPSEFKGRNTPDLSTNADPESGYQFLQDGAVATFTGGTSFVAPQLNGVTALLVEATGQRVGQINPVLYQLGSAATKDITVGDNWGYGAVAGFDNAIGLGTLDATKLLDGLLPLEHSN